MGVTGLWSILYELSERKPLKYLSGKRIAVDLSGWVVQAAKCKGLNTSKNPHLRNLFFRVSRLLQDGALPIFILEGDLPALKKSSFKERNQHHTTKNNNDDKIGRSLFNRVLLQCKDLLHSLGVPCIKSSGEAEAFCAFLCANGIVDGVITEDSDAFLYGADTIYRDFTIDPNDSHVKLYSLNSVKNKLHLDRTKLVALALLLGCDYVKGIPGVGKEAALKLLSEIPDSDLLQRFKDWKEKEESELFPGYQANIKKMTHCSRCDHLGTQTKHKTTGCEMCDSEFACYLSGDTNPCICLWHKSNDIGMKRKAELKIYNAAKKMPDFPNSEVIEEYLCFNDVIPEESALEWKCPNLQEFQEKADTYWGWTSENSYEKYFPILTSWHQFKVAQQVTVDKSCLLVEPVEILKQRTIKGEDILRVQWKKLNDDGDYYVSSESMCSNEYEDRFSKAYPKITEAYFRFLEQNKSKPHPRTKASKTSHGCKKMYDFFVCGPATSGKCSQQSGTQSNCDFSKRCMEQGSNVNEPYTKKHCL